MDLTAYEGSVDPKDVIMLILGVQNDIVGFTRFVKYLFLTCQSGIFQKDELIIPWKSHHYGPYWTEFDAFVITLSNQKLLTMKKEITIAGNTTTKFSITVKGRQSFQDLAQKYQEQLDDLKSLIRSNQNRSLASLLKFVYEKYPEFTTNSVIKDQVLDN